MNAKRMIKKAGNVLFIVLVSVGASYFTFTLVNNQNTEATHSQNAISQAFPANFSKVSYQQANNCVTDFTYAAEKTVNAVVHVKTTHTARAATAMPRDPFFDFFFGRPEFNRPPQPRRGSGSGVIISNHGYIVTNNHVIDRAEVIEVTLNDKRSYTATVVGVDPTTDIALLRIEAENLSPILFGDSDDIRVGEWVLAVGNPFNLTSTVTAGIVSARARNINILTADMSIESFIQTDAAINQGNSGGALVNTRGELIGINTAIATQTGSHAGHAFAVPSSIVSKVVTDLREFGTVQRALLGISIKNVTNEFARERNITFIRGVYVAQVMEGGAAAASGIRESDIITAINGVRVRSVAELQEQVGRHRPGDEVNVTLTRGNRERNISVVLKNKHGTTGIVTRVNLDILGAEFQAVPSAVAQRLRISNGMQVTSIRPRGKFANAGIRRDFIITRLNNTLINSISDIETVVNNLVNNRDNEQGLFITGIYPDGRRAYYVVNLAGN